MDDAPTPYPPPPSEDPDLRRAPRVPMVRSGRMQFAPDALPAGSAPDGGTVSISGAVVDVSERGCQFLCDNGDLPDAWTWPDGVVCRTVLSLGMAGEAELDAKVVWVREQGPKETLVGLQFLPPKGQTERILQGFIGARLRAGLERRRDEG